MYTRFWVIIALMMVSLSAIAAETEIMVRAKAVDSKFIGTR